MKTKLIELFFRHKLQLAALLLVPLLLSMAIVFFLPRTYQASASLWALRRYEIIGATGPESDLQSYPSVTQATALGELLQTESFDLAVAADTDLAKHVGVPAADTERLQAAMVAEISKHVSVTSSGYNLFTISYSNTDPRLATQVVKAVIAHYSQQSTAHATAEGQQLLQAYQSQLKVAQQQADDAAQKAKLYLQEHHLDAISMQTDPQYQLLSQQSDAKGKALADAEANVNTINQQIALLSTGAGGLYQVVDAPKLPTIPESRAKTFLLGGAIGLLVGLLASIGYFIVLVRLDQSVYSPADMPDLAKYPVLIQIPRLPLRSAAWMTNDDENLLSDKGA